MTLSLVNWLFDYLVN